MFHNLRISAICCVLLMVTPSAAAQRHWTVPATGPLATFDVIYHGDDGGRGWMSLNHVAGEHSEVEDVVETHGSREDCRPDERDRKMKRSTTLLDTNRPRSSSYEPQPSDVPVTVATAMILLLVLCIVALL
jgi:hypothetical protein